MRRTPLIIAGVWFLTTLFWWGLAFFPTPTISPDWLVSARNVCFGMRESGLPGLDGWMVLTLGPLSFLLALITIWPGDLWTGLREASRTRLGRYALSVAAAAVLLEAGWVVRKIDSDLRISRIDFSDQREDSLPETYPRSSKPAPDLALTDQSGKKISLAKLRGETVILTFAFAHCQTVCPVLVKQSIEASKNLAGRHVRVLIVTLDPWRDTPKALPYLAQKWTLPEFAHVLSGPITDVLEVLDRFNVPYKRNERTGEVDHPALTYVIAPNGELAYTFNNAPATWLTQAVNRIENEKNIAAARRNI